MRDIVKIILSVCVGITFLTSCEDEDKNPFLQEVPGGGMVLLDEVVNPVFDVTQIASATYEARLRDPNNNVSQYIMELSYNGSDTIPFRTITEFPHDLVITSSDLVTTIQQLPNRSGFSIDSLSAGDRIDFVNTVITEDGIEFSVENTGDDIMANAGQRQGFTYTTFVSCPFESSAVDGVYEILNDEFFGFSGTVEVVSGPGEAQITIKDLSVVNPGLDLIVDVNVSTGEATSTEQETWRPVEEFGLPANFGKGYTTVTSGFVFSCTGLITLQKQHCVDIGCYGGRWNVTLQKQ